MKKLLPVCALLLFVAACNFSGKMKKILQLSEEIKDKYNGSASITINNGSRIEVTLKNSPWCDSSDEAKQRASDDIGRMVAAKKELDKFDDGYTVFSEGNIVKAASRFSMHLHQK